MKNVEIILENKEILTIQDDDDTPIEEYCRKLASLFQVSNITTLIFGEKSLLIRPSKIFAIKVNAIKVEIPNSPIETEFPNDGSTPDMKISEPEIAEEEYEDVITD